MSAKEMFASLGYVGVSDKDLALMQLEFESRELSVIYKNVEADKVISFFKDGSFIIAELDCYGDFEDVFVGLDLFEAISQQVMELTKGKDV